MIKNKKIMLIAIILIMGTVVGMSAVEIKNAKEPQQGVLEDSLGLPTSIMEVEPGKLVEEIAYMGIIESGKSVVVSSKIVGEITQLNFKEGSFVKEGDVIATLDTNQFLAKLNTIQQKSETLKINSAYLEKEIENYSIDNPIIKKIEALEKNYDYLSSEIEKQRSLYEEGIIPKNTLDKLLNDQRVLELQIEELQITSKNTDTASENAYNKMIHEKNMVEAQLKELDAATKELSLNIEETVIIAPISGRIRVMDYNKGELLTMGKPLAIIDDMDDVVIKVNIGEQDLAKISVGTKVIIGLDEERVDGEVTKIKSVLNPATKIGEVEVSYPLEDKSSLIMGASKKVRFILNDEIEETIVINNQFIKEFKDKKVVYVLEGDHVYETEIKVGHTVGDQVQVLDGLKQGDKIAYKNMNALYDGAKVYIFQGVDQT